MIVPLISYEHLKNYITANLKHFFFYQSDAMNSILGQNVHWGLLKLGHASPFKGLLGQYKTQTEFVTELLNVLQQVRVPNRIRKYILRVIMTLVRMWTTNWSNYSLLYRAVFGRSVNPSVYANHITTDPQDFQTFLRPCRSVHMYILDTSGLDAVQLGKFLQIGTVDSVQICIEVRCLLYGSATGF